MFNLKDPVVLFYPYDFYKLISYKLPETFQLQKKPNLIAHHF